MQRLDLGFGHFRPCVAGAFLAKPQKLVFFTDHICVISLVFFRHAFPNCPRRCVLIHPLLSDDLAAYFCLEHGWYVLGISH